MFLCILAIYSLVMLVCPIAISASRGAKSSGQIIALKVFLPIVFVALVLLMALIGGGGDPDYHGAADYMPTVAFVLYLGASIALLIWSCRGRVKGFGNGFPIEPVIGPAQRHGE